MDSQPRIFVGGSRGQLFDGIVRELRQRGYNVLTMSDVVPGERMVSGIRRLMKSAAASVVICQAKSPDAMELDAIQASSTFDSPRVVPVVGAGITVAPFLDGISAVRLDVFDVGNPEFDRLLRALPPVPSAGREQSRTDPSNTCFFAVQIERFRCLRQTQLDVGSARWTVILGDNGSGKTTLLRLLASFGANSERARVIAASATVELELNSKVGRGHFVVRQDSRDKMAHLLPDCFAYGAGRGTRLAALSVEETDPCLSLFDDAGTLPDPEEWLLQTDYAAKLEIAEPRIGKRRDEVIRVLVDLLPDVTHLRFEAHEGRARVEAHTLDGWIPMRDLSFGYRTAMAWVVDLARRLFDRHPQSENPLAETAVVLVDEIDLHLHPRWQRHLLTLLDKTFPKCQFIVTAHSPLIVQAAPDANIVLLRREKDGVVIDNHRDHIRKWRVDQILASELFGEQPTHSPEAQELLDRRAAILAKPELTEADQSELAALREQARSFDAATLPEDLEALDLIQEASKALLK